MDHKFARSTTCNSTAAVVCINTGSCILLYQYCIVLYCIVLYADYGTVWYGMVRHGTVLILIRTMKKIVVRHAQLLNNAVQQ